MADMASVYEIVGVDSLSGPAEAAARGLDHINERAGVAGQAFSALGTVAAAAGAAVAAGIGASVVSAASFEQRVSAIGAVAGATSQQMQALTATALQLGKDTSFSAGEAAAGMEELIKAGVSIGDVIGGGARAALDLAAAGGLSVAESATIASNAMNVFSVSGADMGHVADVIAGAANASAIDVHDFGFSLSAVGAVAATVGLSFEDTATAIAVLGQAGLKGSDAGTSLKTMLLNLNPSSKAAQAEMRNLGIITADGANQFFDAEGKVKSFDQVAQVLQDSMKGLTKEQQINALQTAFGTDAIRAAAIMAKAGAAGFDDMAAAMGKVSAQDVAKARLDNLMGSIEQLRGSLETAAIMIGSLFLPALRGIADTATQSVNAAIGVIEQLPAAWADVVSIFTEQSTAGNAEGLLAALGFSEQSITQIDDWIARAGDAWRTLGQVFAGDWSPDATIDPIVNAIGQIGLVVRDQVLPAVTSVFGWIQENASTIEGALVGVGVAMAAIWAGGAVAAGIAGIGAALALVVSPIGLILVASALLGAAWVNDWGGIQEVTASFVAWFQENAPLMAQTANTITTAVSAAWTAMATDANGQTLSMSQAMNLGFADMLKSATAQMTMLGGVIRAAMQAINGDWSGAWTSLSTAAATSQQLQQEQATAHGDAMIAIIDRWTGGALTSFGTWISTTSTDLATWVTTTGGSIATWATEAASAISTWATNAASAVSTWATDVLSTLSTWATDALSAISTWATNAVTTVTTWGGLASAAVATGIGAVQTALAAGLGLMAAAWQLGWDTLRAIGTAAWALITPENQAKLAELVTALGTFWTVAQAAWTTGTTAVTTLLTTWWTATETLWTTSTTTINTTTTTWWAEAQTLWTTGTTALTTLLTTWWTSVSALWTTATTALTAIITPWLTALEALWTTSTAAVTTTLTAWWATLTALWATATAALTAALTTWWAELTAGWTTAMTAVQTAVQAGLATITGLWTTAVTAIGTAITTAATTLGANALALGSAIVKGVIDGINAAIGGIADALLAGVRGAIGAATSAIPGMGGGGGGGAQTLSYRPGAAGSGPSEHANQYLPLINQIAAQQGEDPALIAALVATEGSGATSVSPAGAAGIMQVVPGQGFNLPGENAADPATSIMQGIRAVRAKRAALGPGATPADIAGAYFGYGTDAGGMTTGGYRARFQGFYNQYSLPSAPDWPTGVSTDPNAMQRLPIGAGMATTGPGLQPGAPAQAAAPSGLPQTATELQTVIALAPTWTTAVQAMNTAAQAAFTGILTSGTAMGDGVTLTITQTGATAVATMTDAGGKILGTWTSSTQGVADATSASMGQVATEVQAGSDAVTATGTEMAAQAQVWATTMGQNIITQIQDATGSLETITTDASGQVVSAFGEMVSGTTANVSQMGNEVLTTFTALDGSMTSVVTDASGKVVTQWSQMRDEVGVASHTMETTATTEAQTTQTNVVAAFTATGTQVGTITSNMETAVVDAAHTGQVGATVEAQTAQSNVVTAYDATGTQVGAAMDTMATAVTDGAHTMQDRATVEAQGMDSNVSTAAGSMSQTVGGLVDTMATAVATAAHTMQDRATVEAQGMDSTVTTAATSMGGNVARATSGMASAVGEAAHTVSSALGALPQAFSGVSTASEGAASAGEAAAKALAQTWANAARAIGNSLSQIGNAIKAGASSPKAGESAGATGAPASGRDVLPSGALGTVDQGVIEPGREGSTTLVFDDILKSISTAQAKAFNAFMTSGPRPHTSAEISTFLAAQKAQFDAAVAAQALRGPAPPPTHAIDTSMPGINDVPSAVLDVPSMASGSADLIDYDRLARIIQNGSPRNYNLNITSTAQTEPLVQDFEILEAQSRSSI